MPIRSFTEMRGLVDKNTRKTIVIASAHDRHTLEAVFEAVQHMPLDFILVGFRDKINEIVQELGEECAPQRIIDSENDEDAAFKAVQVVREGKAQMLMKGLLPTAVILKAALNRQTGIRDKDLMHHIMAMEVPFLNRMLFVTDGAMVTHPSLDQKKVMLHNLIEFMGKFSYDQPKIALLAASETVNTAMPESMDAKAIMDDFDAGVFGTAAVVEGPMAFDVAVSSEAAEIKGLSSKVSGHVDAFLAPEIVSANAMCKALVYGNKAKMAGCVVGTAAPIVLTTRSASAEEKFDSILLSLISVM